MKFLVIIFVGILRI